MNIYTESHIRVLIDDLKKRINHQSFIEDNERIKKKFRSDFDVVTNPLLSTPEEDLFEWIDVVESVKNAKNKFVMFELGAGYGRWCVNALHALNFYNNINYEFIAVEAEPTHFAFLKEYFSAYGINETCSYLINSALSSTEGFAFFNVGDPNGWYGQFLDSTKVNVFHRILDKFILHKNPVAKRKKVVNTISLNSILCKYSLIDLIDMDIQSSELEVCMNSISQIEKTTKRLHIATHSIHIHNKLVDLLSDRSWKINFCYPPFSKSKTILGEFYLNDGVISACNPNIKNY
jgi:FkbM family methyltransferase